jgi:ankyrin repeat protein
MSLEWLLFAAVQRGAVADVQSILDTGQADVNARDDGDWTPLMRAVANDDPQTVAVLLARGADPFYADRSGLMAWGLANPEVKAVLLPAMTVRDARDGKGLERLDPRHPAPWPSRG